MGIFPFPLGKDVLVDYSAVGILRQSSGWPLIHPGLVLGGAPVRAGGAQVPGKQGRAARCEGRGY